MNLANRLFQIIDDEPVYSVVLINLKCFKDLYMLDKTDDKHKYMNQLVYIWYTCDPSSPYFHSEDAEDDAALEVYGRKKVVTKQLRKCMNEYTKRQSTPIIRAYKRAMKITDQNESLLQQNKEQIVEWERLIDDANLLMQGLGRNPEDIAARIDIMERMEDLQTKRLKRESDMTALIPKINSQVTQLLELKKQVDKDRLQIDSDDNQDAVANFIVDEFIEKHM